jgi:hypothetical protein
MKTLTIDPRGITLDLLRPTDSSALTDVVREAVSRTRSMDDGAGFDNKVRVRPRTS